MESLRTAAAMIDSSIIAAAIPLALLIFISGLDDLFIYAVWTVGRLRQQGSAPARDSPVRRIAIFVPCWHESAVIGQMVEHNVAAIRHQAFDFFIGAYPNDEPTLSAVRGLESRFRNVHLATCPHNGPTSKADCLNWIYQRMQLYEEEHRDRFEIVVTHDAEDLIHPDALRAIEQRIGEYGMVQIPVLPLPTPLAMFTHGVYCDEFAEFQWKDMRARAMMGSFIPSNGVGTGYARAALEQLADAENNRIFEPACLTEDYENGMRLHRMGFRQAFVPLARGPNGFLATREYFPTSRRTAVRQRTRWVTGVSLQTWERHGWRGSPQSVYWFWRDRKGLVGNPASLAANLLFGLGCATCLHARLTGNAWGLDRLHLPTYLTAPILINQLIQLSGRMLAVNLVYGWRFALGVPLRLLWGNFINASATALALVRYTRARILKIPLVWVKTEHAYPTLAALRGHKRKLGEILVGSGYLDQAQLDLALATQPAGVRIGEHLVALSMLTQDHLYEALSLQQSVPAVRLRPVEVRPAIARSLPLSVIRKWRIVPYRVELGSLYLASPEIPADELNAVLRAFTRMAPRFQLITPANFDELTHALL